VGPGALRLIGIFLPLYEKQDFFVHHRTVSAVKRVQFISDRMSYIVLRGRWCRIIVLNVHAPTEEKSGD